MARKAYIGSTTRAPLRRRCAPRQVPDGWLVGPCPRSAIDHPDNPVRAKAPLVSPPRSPRQRNPHPRGPYERAAGWHCRLRMRFGSEMARSRAHELSQTCTMGNHRAASAFQRCSPALVTQLSVNVRGRRPGAWPLIGMRTRTHARRIDDETPAPGDGGAVGAPVVRAVVERENGSVLLTGPTRMRSFQ